MQRLVHSNDMRIFNASLPQCSSDPQSYLVTADKYGLLNKDLELREARCPCIVIPSEVLCKVQGSYAYYSQLAQTRN